eukprot:4986635-Amphidinium_carterae.1
MRQQHQDPRNHAPIKSTPLNKEQHSQYRTNVGQLLWVSQLRADIANAVKELSRSLRCPDEEDQRNMKQLLRQIKGTIHYKVQLEPKVEHNDKGQIKVSIESSADSDPPQCVGEFHYFTSVGLNLQLP